MMASRRASGSNTISSCALCEGSNLPSCCVACVNTRLFEYYATLRLRRNLRDTLQFHIVAPRGQDAVNIPMPLPPHVPVAAPPDPREHDALARPGRPAPAQDLSGGYKKPAATRRHVPTSAGKGGRRKGEEADI
ncbi:hypothetical protein ZWY2020_002749 [Hordeum vulgare]|nr:hypothetical protein ZWY2020_002749 [Hordeum vulgare]